MIASACGKGTTRSASTIPSTRTHSLFSSFEQRISLILQVCYLLKITSQNPTIRIFPQLDEEFHLLGSVYQAVVEWSPILLSLSKYFPSFLFFYSFRGNHVLIELPPLLKFIHLLRRYWIWMAYLAYFLMLWPVDDERVLDSLSYLCRTIASIQSYLYIAMQLEMHPFRIINPVFQSIF